MVNFVATTHLRVKRDATEATVARYLLIFIIKDTLSLKHISIRIFPLLMPLTFIPFRQSLRIHNKCHTDVISVWSVNAVSMIDYIMMIY